MICSPTASSPSNSLDADVVDSPSSDVTPGDLTTPRVSVIVCAYTLDRWDLLGEALDSLTRQDLAPIEVILCIDHNHEMYERCVAQLPALVATGDVLAFLDDDAAATPTWLSTLTAPYDDPGVVAVGGAPIARYETERPRWIPHECNWIFGCAYRGLPQRRSPIEQMIGAYMSVRRRVLLSWGGFHSDNHDDMDLSHRAIHAHGAAAVLYEPDAVVRHFVPASRLTWGYFWRRCFNVNRGKVRAFRDMNEASNLAAELRFVRRSLSRALVSEGRALLHGDLYAPVRYGAPVCAIALGGAGAIAGRLR